MPGAEVDGGLEEVVLGVEQHGCRGDQRQVPRGSAGEQGFLLAQRRATDCVGQLR